MPCVGQVRSPPKGTLLVLTESQERDPHPSDQVAATPALRLGGHTNRGVQGAETAIAASLDNLEKEPISKLSV
jgi:alpha-beta hydrolase superfamily lysophospholipase